MMHKPLRILQIVPNISPLSGVVQVVLNWHRHLDTSRIQFDYLYFKPLPQSSLEEITRLGGKCTFIHYKKIWKLVPDLIHYFHQNHYAIIHSHVTQLPAIIFPIAKLFGVKQIIQHAHATRWSDKKILAMRNYLMLHSVWPLITQRLACSNQSGKFFFKKNFMIIPNSIDGEKFAYNPIVRARKRKELNVENNFVVGHVGRLNPEKNHIFLLQIFEKIIKRNPSAKLILIGNGPLEEKLKQMAKEKNIKDNVLFLGARSDVPDLLQAFDVFILPSLFEGFGIVAIEAQAAGLPCVLADTLPLEAFVCNCQKLPLRDAEQWANTVLQYQNNFERKDTVSKITKGGFSAKEVAEKMQNFYLTLGQ